MGNVEIVIQGTSGPRAVELDGSVHIGRGPDNDLVVADGEVSWRHALVYMESGGVWIRDLDSRNGTLVDGVAVKGPTRLSERSRVRIGDVDLFVRGLVSAQPTPMLVEEVGTGVQHPLNRERFVIGPGADADLRVPDVQPVTLLKHGNGEIWMGADDEDRQLMVDEPIKLANFSFVVRSADPNRVPTVEGAESPYVYELQATLDGPTGPEATLRDLESGDEIRWSAETRAVLLYLLGRQVARDREARRTLDEVGWIGDEDLIVSVWGKTPRADGLARLKTLVHRVRGGCREAGLNPWCIEKRRGYTRIRLHKVTLT
ncbi:MAG: FHA domain-containing protein [Myxococcales bacterium]|nr:FHA domain-containing protein [Myxococcales bacterium]